jgi:hypothetical protein
MSSHELDSDLARWPENPYELLGVSFGVLPRDLRRAYTRLIRVYKPEQYPEHFQRIRDAYETILRHIEMFGFLGTHEEPPDEEPSPQPAEASPAEDFPFSLEIDPPAGRSADEPPLEREEDEGVDADIEEILQRYANEPPPEREEDEEPLRPHPRLSGLDEELCDLWDRVCKGEVETVYHRLRELHEKHPGQSAVYLRLYWLLALYPELDSLRSPCDWLATGLRATGLTGDLHELYRREMEGDPAEALTGRCAQLLACPVRAGLLASVAEWRWQAAGRLGQWDVVARDVQFLRGPILREDEEIWVRLLLSAVDQLAWAPELSWRELKDRYCQEIEQFPHLATHLGGELDRLDFLRELSSGWHLLRARQTLPSTHLHLIPLGWTRPFAEVRPAFLVFLNWVAHYPHDALRNFDAIKQQASGVLAQFGRLLDQYRDEMDEPPPEPSVNVTTTRLVLDFFDEVGFLDYQDIRPRLLDFCLREAIAPEMMAEIVDGRPAYHVSDEEHLAQGLTNDWALRYVVLAHQLFWA